MGELVSLLDEKVAPSYGYPGQLLSGSIAPQVKCAHWPSLLLRVVRGWSEAVDLQHTADIGPGAACNESRSPSISVALWWWLHHQHAHRRGLWRGPGMNTRWTSVFIFSPNVSCCLSSSLWSCIKAWNGRSLLYPPSPWQPREGLGLYSFRKIAESQNNLKTWSQSAVHWDLTFHFPGLCPTMHSLQVQRRPALLPL